MCLILMTIVNIINIYISTVKNCQFVLYNGVIMILEQKNEIYLTLITWQQTSKITFVSWWKWM